MVGMTRLLLDHLLAQLVQVIRQLRRSLSLHSGAPIPMELPGMTMVQLLPTSVVQLPTQQVLPSQRFHQLLHLRPVTHLLIGPQLQMDQEM